MNDEIESAIRYLGQEDKIFVCTFEKKSLFGALSKADATINTNEPCSFYLILNNTNDIYTEGNHWTSAKITVNDADVVIEYANTGKFGSSVPDQLKNALAEKFKPKEIKEKKEDNVLTQWSFWECGYLSLFNCLRDIDGLSQIGDGI